MGDHFNYYNAAARRSNTLYGVHTASYSLVGGRTAERHGNKMIRALPANHLQSIQTKFFQISLVFSI
ncbi:unnamed protein product [Haemonchus placei]|uniref:Uncharacterized protein n=1 Tax=Haemonchus placei TaxID=6290 RepID=A0A0N4VXC1_HAEPC|nr:unnamed protein product [Haemonchus placei]